MVAITIKNIPEEIYTRLKQQAQANHRSLNSEIIARLEMALRMEPIDVEETLARARQVREWTAHYRIGEDELRGLKDEGRP